LTSKEWVPNGMGLETRSVGGLALCWVAEKLQPFLQEKLCRDLWPDAVCRGGPLSPQLCSPVVDELTRGLNKNDIHWVMQMTMLSSFTENSQAPSQSFSRRL